MIGIEQFANTNAAYPADLILITRPNAPTRCADRGIALEFAQTLFFEMVRENDVGMIADYQIVADRDTRLAEVVHFLEKAGRIHHHAIGNDGTNLLWPQNPGGQQRKFERLPVTDDCVTGVGPAVVANDKVVLVGEQIDNFALGLVAPLQADDTGAAHGVHPTRLRAAFPRKDKPRRVPTKHANDRDQHGLGPSLCYAFSRRSSL